MSLPLILHRRYLHLFRYPHLFPQIPLLRRLSALPSEQTPLPANPSDPRSNLSARLSFVFDQIDAIDQRPQQQQKDHALQLIRQWRQSRNQQQDHHLEESTTKVEELEEKKERTTMKKKKEVEVVHPWPEWIELMERLGQQNYLMDFHQRRVAGEEDRLAESVGIDLSREVDVVEEEVGFDFTRDWTTVRNACMNFGKDRFDILRSLSRKDLQVLVGHGCPSTDLKVVFSAKLLRKLTHLDEGDVCSSCSLRNSCSRGYILTRKEDEARTLDVMRILLTFGFDHVNGAVENKGLMLMKSLKTVIRKLLHEIVKLSAVPIDPNLPPPVIKKPPPKVKQPPPQPKKRVGRDDVEMKKGDWLCPKCDFMNFAKNTVCLQCDAKRPKRQLLPGEWECPQCNFLNYRRNMACFHCDAKRPPDEFTENQFQPKQSGPRTRLDRPARVQDVSNAWNFDFDDNESDGADVAAFEFANSSKMDNRSDLEDLPHGRTSRGFEDDTRNTSKIPRTHEQGGRYFSDPSERNPTIHSDRTGFDDFDDEEDDDDVDSYELDGSNNTQARGVSVKNFSEVENTSDSEDFGDFKPAKNYISGSEEDDELVDHPQLKSSHIAQSWQKSQSRGGKYLGSDDDIELGSDFDDDDMNEGFGSIQSKNRQQSSGRKGVSSRRGRGSDLEDELLLDLDSDRDNDSSYSGRNRSKTSGNNNFRKSNNFGSSRRGESRSEDWKSSRRRDSFDGDQNDDFFSRASNRGGYKGRRENDRFDNRSDRLDDRRGNRRDSFGGNQNDDFSFRSSCRGGYNGGRENVFHHRSDRLDGRRENRRDSFGGNQDDNFSSRSSRRGGYNEGRENDFHRRSDRPDGRRRENRRDSFGGDHNDDFSFRGSHRDGNGYGGRRENDEDRRGRRSNQFSSDRSRGGSKRNERGSRGEGRGGWGKDDGFQRRSSRFSD